MTTITWDGRLLCGDGKACASEIVTDLNIKKIRVVEGRVYALCGVWPMFDRLIDWHHSGADPEKAPKIVHDQGWGLIVVDREGAGQFTNDCPYLDRFAAPWAWGSGRQLALGAMYAGKSAYEALQIACERDLGTGGDIQVIDIAEALGLNQQRQAAE